MKLLQMSLAGGVMILVITVHPCARRSNGVPKKTFLAALGRGARCGCWRRFRCRPQAEHLFPAGAARCPRRQMDSRPATAGSSGCPGGRSELPQRSTAVRAMRAAPVWTLVWAAGLAALRGGVRRRLRALRRGSSGRRCPVEQRICPPAGWRSHPLRRTIAIRQSGPHLLAARRSASCARSSCCRRRRTGRTRTALRYVLEHEFVHIQRFDSPLQAPADRRRLRPLVQPAGVGDVRAGEPGSGALLRRDGAPPLRRRRPRLPMPGSSSAWRSGQSAALQPLCNHFGKNAIEERITAIMKTKRITIVSLGLAALLVAGTVTVFATSAQGGTSGTPVKASGAFAEENAAFAGSGGTAVESGVPLQPDTEYTAAGISGEGRLWYYAGQPVRHDLRRQRQHLHGRRSRRRRLSARPAG